MLMILIFGSKSGFGDDFGQYDTKTIILRHFLTKRLLETALPWPHLTIWKGVLYINTKSHKVSASYT